MKIHELKSWPEQFDAVRSGDKTHEIRANDRDFRAGDVLHLREWMPEGRGQLTGAVIREGAYTGNELLLRVTFINAPGTFGLPPTLCVMSVKLIGWQIHLG